MKKHNEGYALPFVLVVFLIISLVATSVLTVSLRNLQSQKASIQRMEEQYVAQGEIEKVESEIRFLLEKHNNTISDVIIGNDVKAGSVGSLNVIGSVQNIQALTLSVVAQTETVQVSAVVRISGSKIDVSNGSIYTITAPKITYDSYTITTIDGGDT